MSVFNSVLKENAERIHLSNATLLSIIILLELNILGIIEND